MLNRSRECNIHGAFLTINRFRMEDQDAENKKLI